MCYSNKRPSYIIRILIPASIIYVHVLVNICPCMPCLNSWRVMIYAGIFKLLRSIGTDSKESFQPAYVAYIAGRYNNLIPIRFLTPINCSKIPALAL